MESKIGLVSRLSAISSLCYSPATYVAREGNVPNPEIFSTVAVSRVELLFALGMSNVDPESELGRAVNWTASATTRRHKYSALAFATCRVRRELGRVREELVDEAGRVGVQIHNPRGIWVETLRQLINRRYEGWCAELAKRCRSVVADLAAIGVSFKLPRCCCILTERQSPTTGSLRVAHQELLQLDRALTALLAEELEDTARHGGRFHRMAG